ncbi:unnamed protein product [Owenia fusiformis]|uniref:Uncharacterized protein n=1 Tax=Owenia fusiformis TaxID=6347 RepID=A0A8J1UEC6_OWEFU|nr:unnamed protein product [Owenia fusiformis]
MFLLKKMFNGEEKIKKGEQVKMEDSRIKLLCKFGKKGSGKGCMNMPSDVAINSEGDIIVVDSDNHKIQVYSNDGHFKIQFGGKGTSPHQLIHPMCVTIAMDDIIAVTDSVNGCVKQFHLDNGFHRQLCSNNTFPFPYGIAFSNVGVYAVTDICKHCVTILNRDGRQQSRFGCYGNESYEFDHPYHVTITLDQQVVVSDTGNSSIKIFTLSGTILKIFTSTDFRLFGEEFIYLQGLCCDTDNNVLVVGNNTVFVIAKNGRFWEVLLPQDGLHSPKGICYSTLGQLIVSQAGFGQKHEVSVFKYHKEDYRSLRRIPLSSVQPSNRSSI